MKQQSLKLKKIEPVSQLAEKAADSVMRMRSVKLKQPKGLKGVKNV
jgi:hypothetical protein